MKWTLVFLLTLIALVSGCGKLFPKCDDPTKPYGGCAPVDPDYPPGPAFAARDAGADG